MAAITADNTTIPETKVIPVDGMIVDYPVAASTAIYKNSFVGLNATGYLTSHVAATAAATASGAAPNGTRFVGIALEAIASQTSDGDATCKVQIDGYFQYTLASVAVTDVGNPVFMSTNADLTATARTGQCCGYIVQREAANTALIRLDPFLALDTGKLLTVTTAAIDLATVNDKILLVHETQNPTGLLLCTCSAYCTTTHLCTTTAGIITLQHTADTTLGCTLTVTNEAPIGDLVVGSGGSLWNPASATDDNIIIVPAGVQVNAEVTTASNEGAVEQGEVIICATFVRV
jgi:hypothetical protein